jgi:hypothetical protein
MSKNYVITATNAGGEYTFGTVTGDMEKSALLDAVDYGEVELSIELEDGDSLESCDTNDILQVYGPEYDYATITVDVANEEFDKVDTIIDDSIDNLGLSPWQDSNPYITPEIKETLDDDFLLWGTQKVEKRINFPVYLTLDDDEEFDINNVFFGYTNLDETIGDIEIISNCLYINKENQVALMKELYKDDYEDGDDFADALIEIADSNRDKLTKFELEIGDIQGKGDIEHEWCCVFDSDNEMLYEGEEY